MTTKPTRPNSTPHPPPPDEARRIREQWFQLYGWLLFVVSALFFLWSGATAGDPVLVVGSAFFLVACFVFLWPLAEDIFERYRNGRGG